MNTKMKFSMMSIPSDDEMSYTVSKKPNQSEVIEMLRVPDVDNYEYVPTDSEVTYHLNEYSNSSDFGIKADNTATASTTVDDKNNDAAISKEIADDLSNRFTFANDEGGLYVYNEKTGVYELLRKNGDYYGTITHFITNNATYYQDRLKSSIFNLVYMHLRNDRKLSKKMPKCDDRMVALRNGVYNIITGEFVDHNPCFGLKFGIAAYYISRPVLGPISEKFFKQVGGGSDGAKTNLASLGITVSNYRKLGKAIILYGPRCNGKSTEANLVREVMLPPKSVRGLSITDFGNQFAIANLKDAHVTICTDLPVGGWSKNAISKFKQTVTGDFFEAGAKGVQQDTIQPSAFIVFISNFLPKIPKSQDPEGAVQRRIWPIKTGESIPPDQVDPDILGKLLDDVDAIISVALQEATKLLKSEQLAELTSAHDEIYESSPVMVEECMDEYVYSLVFTNDTSDTIPLQKLFDRFTEQYKNQCPGLDSMVINGFAKHLRRSIKTVGGYVKKFNNVSTLFGYKFRD